MTHSNVSPVPFKGGEPLTCELYDLSHQFNQKFTTKVPNRRYELARFKDASPSPTIRVIAHSSTCVVYSLKNPSHLRVLFKVSTHAPNIFKLHTSKVHTVKFCHSRSHVVASATDQELCVWAIEKSNDAQSATPLEVRQIPTTIQLLFMLKMNVVSLAWVVRPTQDGDLLVMQKTNSDAHRVSLLQCETLKHHQQGSEVATYSMIPHGERVLEELLEPTAALTASGVRDVAYSINDQDLVLRSFENDVRTSVTRKLKPCLDSVVQDAVLMDSDVLIAMSHTGVYVWNAVRLQCVQHIKVGAALPGVNCHSIHATGTRLVLFFKNQKDDLQRECAVFVLRPELSHNIVVATDVSFCFLEYGNACVTPSKQDEPTLLLDQGSALHYVSLAGEQSLQITPAAAAPPSSVAVAQSAPMSTWDPTSLSHPPSGILSAPQAVLMGIVRTDGSTTSKKSPAPAEAMGSPPTKVRGISSRAAHAASKSAAQHQQDAPAVRPFTTEGTDVAVDLTLARLKSASTLLDQSRVLSVRTRDKQVESVLGEFVQDVTKFQWRKYKQRELERAEREVTLAANVVLQATSSSKETHEFTSQLEKEMQSMVTDATDSELAKWCTPASLSTPSSTSNVAMAGRDVVAIELMNMVRDDVKSRTELHRLKTQEGQRVKEALTHVAELETIIVRLTDVIVDMADRGVEDELEQLRSEVGGLRQRIGTMHGRHQRRIVINDLDETHVLAKVKDHLSNNNGSEALETLLLYHSGSLLVTVLWEMTEEGRDRLLTDQTITDAQWDDVVRVLCAVTNAEDLQHTVEWVYEILLDKLSALSPSTLDAVNHYAQHWTSASNTPSVPKHCQECLKDMLIMCRQSHRPSASHEMSAPRPST